MIIIGEKKFPGLCSMQKYLPKNLHATTYQQLSQDWGKCRVSLCLTRLVVLLVVQGLVASSTNLPPRCQHLCPSLSILHLQPEHTSYLSSLVHHRNILACKIKSKLKSAWICAKIAQMGQNRPNFALFMQKYTSTWKITLQLVVAVVINISYEPN